MISGDRTLAQGHRGAFYNTLQELHGYWEQINVITPPVGKNISQVFFGNVTIHSSPWPLLMQPWFIFKKGLQLFNRQPFDVVTVHEYPPFYNGIGAWLLHRKIGVPYLLEIMHITGYPRAGNIKEVIYRFLTKLLIRFDAKPATKIRVINRRQTPEFLIRAGVPKDKIIYIPAFYIDLKIFVPQNVNKDIDYLFVGRLVNNKGIFLFLDAVRQLNGRAYIIGEGSARGRIKQYLVRHRLEHRIHLHGWAANAKEIAQIMNRSRVLIMPSYNEGGPRVVLEAMACGVPVVATPVGIVPDVLPPECIEEWNANNIAKKMRNILQDESLYQRLSRQGLMTVRQFERVAAIKAYVEGIKRLTP